MEACTSNQTPHSCMHWMMPKYCFCYSFFQETVSGFCAFCVEGRLCILAKLMTTLPFLWMHSQLFLITASIAHWVQWNICTLTIGFDSQLLHQVHQKEEKPTYESNKLYVDKHIKRTVCNIKNAKDLSYHESCISPPSYRFININTQEETPQQQERACI